MILKQPFHLFSKLTIFLIMFFYPKPHWMHMVFFIIQQIQNQFQITWLSDSQELVDIQSITPNQSLILSFWQRYSLRTHVVLTFTEPWFFFADRSQSLQTNTFCYSIVVSPQSLRIIVSEIKYIH